jgi:nucleoside-triphosphatase
LWRFYQSMDAREESVARQNERSSKIIVVTGPFACGKTALCLRLAEEARAGRLVVCGILSLPRLVDGVKVGIDLLDVGSGARCSLAEAHAQTNGPRTASWRFHSGTLAWGSDILRHATPCDLLLIDELGPLELVRGEGWSEAIEMLRSGGYRWAVVVVRPGLVDRFLQLVPNMQTMVMPATAVGGLHGESLAFLPS